MTLEEKREYERNWYATIGKEKRKAANNAWRKKTRNAFNKLKEGLHCAICGENHPACLDFHHIDPDTKEFHISSKAGALSAKTLKAEMDKCIVLCANCHRKEHAG